MPLSHIAISDFRNISSAIIEPSASLNFLYGVNGSGKTSVLECVSLLGLGRSFRSRKHTNLVQYGRHEFTLFAKLLSQPGDTLNTIGLTRGRPSQSKTLINSSAVHSSASLAELLPLQWIDSNTFSLLDGGPSERRSFIDWIVFHVKHSFRQLWSDYHKCLKQRNALLRHGKMSSYDLGLWDKSLSEYGERLSQSRIDAVSSLLPLLTEFVNQLSFIDGAELAISYQAGWNTSSSLLSELEARRELDIKRGHTSVGPHKSDIKILVNGRPAAEVFSRGQQKAFVSAMVFAQLSMVERLIQAPITLLIDDLSAELDSKAQELIARWVVSLNVQCFITGISLPHLIASWPDSMLAQAKMFHVKHGEVTEELYDGEVNDR